MTSSRPYLIRALYEWINDNQQTPHILINTKMQNVEVPSGFDNDGELVLNISHSAAGNLRLGNDLISFTAGFRGERHHIKIPIEAVMGAYSKETGMGMVFDNPMQPYAPTPEVAEPPKVSGRPQLKIVK